MDASSMLKSGTTIYAVPDDAHCYQNGDFVVERKDTFKTKDFPIWRIGLGRLLQKFEPHIHENQFCHKAISDFKSWTGEVRCSFKAVKVDVMTGIGKKLEIVRMTHDFFCNVYDDCLNEHVLVELFAPYVQNMLSQSLESSFIPLIIQQQEEHHLEPMRKIDRFLQQAQDMLVAQVNWDPNFELALNQLPYYKIVESNWNICHATIDPNVLAKRMIILYGPEYNRENLEIYKDPENTSGEINDDHLAYWDSGNKKAYLIEESSTELITTYHALHHFKFQLFKDCQNETTYRKINNQEMNNSNIVLNALANKLWVQYHFKNLNDLFRKCSNFNRAQSSAYNKDPQLHGGIAAMQDDANKAQRTPVLSKLEEGSRTIIIIRPC